MSAKGPYFVRTPEKKYFCSDEKWRTITQLKQKMTYIYLYKFPDLDTAKAYIANLGIRTLQPVAKNTVRGDIGIGVNSWNMAIDAMKWYPGLLDPLDSASVKVADTKPVSETKHTAAGDHTMESVFAAEDDSEISVPNPVGTEMVSGESEVIPFTKPTNNVMTNAANDILAEPPASPLNRESNDSCVTLLRDIPNVVYAPDAFTKKAVNTALIADTIDLMEQLSALCERWIEVQKDSGAEVSKVDMAICDELHFVEFMDLDMRRAYKSYKRLHDLRIRRRQINTELESVPYVFGPFGISPMTFHSKVQQVVRSLNGLLGRKYTPRVTWPVEDDSYNFSADEERQGV